MNYSTAILDRPADDEFELSIFGPAYGEGIVVHVGNNDWIVVDSCTNGSDSSPAALSYFRRINVDPERVRLVAVTHWHDDHIRGISEVFRSCKSANFACPISLGTREFLSLLSYYRRPCLINHHGVSELNTIFQELEKRKVRPIYGIEGRSLYSATYSSHSVVEAMSPSDLAHEKSVLALSKLRPMRGAVKTKLLAGTPNHLAMAIRIDALGQSIVLGSDVEVVANNSDGWSRIRTVQASRARAHLLKVPHHGSETAFCEPYWNDCMAQDGIAVMTPFVRAGVVLPTEVGIEKLLSVTSRLFITASPKRMVAKIKDKSLSEMLAKAVVGPIYSIPRAAGGITFRSRIDSCNDWSVHFHGTASQIHRRGTAANAA